MAEEPKTRPTLQFILEMARLHYSNSTLHNFHAALTSPTSESSPASTHFSYTYIILETNQRWRFMPLNMC